ncbi:hypothetical protein EG327_008233 [Venturia inaequalis]|uniref:Uncharacterized protein n=1 Tax=Venturia inaequalis TaxID=5025 RepID=A0A8H3UVG3_VENIN|nr:hypothetical protein EG327_008233 [Venturia inaequalis]
MCPPENPHLKPTPIENLAANQETLQAILSTPEPPHRPILRPLYTFTIWIYPFPKPSDMQISIEQVEDIGHICCRTDEGRQHDMGSCYDIVAAEMWPPIQELEEENSFDILLEYYVEDEATMDYIVDRLKEKYESEEEGYKHVEVFEGLREFPAGSGNFIEVPGEPIEVQRYAALED